MAKAIVADTELYQQVISKLDQQIENCNFAIRVKHVLFGAYDQEVRDMFQGLKRIFDDIFSVLSRNKDEIDNLNKEIAQLSKDLNKTTQELKKARGDIESLSSNVAKLEQDKINIQQNCDQLQKIHTQLKDRAMIFTFDGASSGKDLTFGDIERDFDYIRNKYLTEIEDQISDEQRKVLWCKLKFYLENNTIGDDFLSFWGQNVFTCIKELREKLIRYNIPRKVLVPEQGDLFDNNCHELDSESSQKSIQVIDHCIFPGLVIYESRRRNIDDSKLEYKVIKSIVD